MKKIFVILSALALFTAQAYAADAPLVEVLTGPNSGLPDIEGWFNYDVRTTKLNTVSGYQGEWIERGYRTAQGVPCHAVRINGAGPKGWKAKQISGTADDGLLGEGATFKSLTICGFAAEFDRHPAHGCSLAVRLPDSVLTLESKYASEAEIIQIAETLIKKITGK
ncbi:MAG: hypothetical protein Q4E34_03120 [Synergistaceae bacterium]|nr:hypothetical protein [Synergistaceae bacterium]